MLGEHLQIDANAIKKIGNSSHDFIVYEDSIAQLLKLCNFTERTIPWMAPIP